MQKAYDTILQSEVSADLAALNSVFEPYRYECACCGEEVTIAAANSRKMVPHFRHRNGNNDIECENYVGKYGAINIDSRSRKSNRERAELYFDKNTMTFNIGFRFTPEEISMYEQRNAILELRSSFKHQPLLNIKINSTNFAPDTLTIFPIDKFSFSYFLSNTINSSVRKYDFFKPDNTPLFFKIQGNNSNFKAKLVNIGVIYTNTSYLVIFQGQYLQQQTIKFSNDVNIDNTFTFKTMNKQFKGQVITIKNKNHQIESLLSSWGYQLEPSETLVVLWPPVVSVDDVSVIFFDHAYIYTSFELQAHGNINVHPKDIHRCTKEISKILVKHNTKIYKQNAEITLDKRQQHNQTFDKLLLIESYTSKYTVQDNIPTFLFSLFGTKCLSRGQTVLLTPKDQIRRYYFGYNIDRIYPLRQEELKGEQLLTDILSHYKRTESFDKKSLSTVVMSEFAAEYIKNCEASGLINPIARMFIEEGWL